ncbi:MAG: hypothetical protein QM702_12475 [Rubrivivax sp.]
MQLGELVDQGLHLRRDIGHLRLGSRHAGAEDGAGDQFLDRLVDRPRNLRQLPGVADLDDLPHLNEAGLPGVVDDRHHVAVHGEVDPRLAGVRRHGARALAVEPLPLGPLGDDARLREHLPHPLSGAGDVGEDLLGEPPVELQLLQVVGIHQQRPQQLLIAGGEGLDDLARKFLRRKNLPAVDRPVLIFVDSPPRPGGVEPAVLVDLRVAVRVDLAVHLEPVFVVAELVDRPVGVLPILEPPQELSLRSGQDVARGLPRLFDLDLALGDVGRGGDVDLHVRLLRAVLEQVLHGDLRGRLAGSQESSRESQEDAESCPSSHRTTPLSIPNLSSGGSAPGEPNPVRRPIVFRAPLRFVSKRSGRPPSLRRAAAKSGKFSREAENESSALSAVPDRQKDARRRFAA